MATGNIFVNFARRVRTVGQNDKNSPKNRFLKNREIVWSYLWFATVWQILNMKMQWYRTRKYCKSTERCLKKILNIKSGEFICWRILATWNHCAAALGAAHVIIGFTMHHHMQMTFRKICQFMWNCGEMLMWWLMYQLLFHFPFDTFFHRRFCWCSAVVEVA